MLPRRLHLCYLALAAALLASGCASSSSIDLPYEQEWATSAELSDQGIVDVSQAGEQVVALRDPNQRDLVILDGQSGEPVRRQKQGLLSKMVGSIDVGGGLEVGDFTSDSYEYVMLEEAGLVLLFSFDIQNNVVRAVDLVSGEDVWKTTRYAWSNEKYAALAGKVASEMASETMGTTGSFRGDMALASAGFLAADALTQKRPVERLIAPLPGQDAFVFKTKDGLVALESRTGKELWRLPEFEGAGIERVVEMPDGDLLIFGLFDVNYLGSLVSDFSIARVSPETGEKTWMTDFAGLAVRDMHVLDNTLVIDARKLQAFDLDSGELLWDQTTTFEDMPLPLVTDEALYVQLPNDEGGAVLSRRNLRSGDVEWQVDLPQRRALTAYSGDAVLIATSGDVFDGRGGVLAYDPATGEELWRSEPFAEAGRQLMTGLRDELRGVETTNVLVDGNRAWVAGPKSFYGFDATTGQQLFQTNHVDAGAGMAVYLQDLGDNVALISQEGVSFYSKDSGERLAAAPLERRLKGFFVEGKHLFALHGEHLSIIDINAGAFKAEIPFDALTMGIYGNLGDGYEVTGGGRHLFLLDDAQQIHKYRLVR